MESHGAYLLENGQQMILWLGRSVPGSFISDVLGVADVTQVDITQHLLPTLETDLSRRIRSVLTQIRSERPRYLHLQIIRQQLDVILEKELNPFLIEDKTMDNPSYVDYLCAVHR